MATQMAIDYAPLKGMSLREVKEESVRSAIVGALRSSESVAEAGRSIATPHRTIWNWISRLEIDYERELGRDLQ